ncbi:MAG: DUF86 domain-containing protein [Candidatus Omnitrophica bacterium]|nr:DUF86 domain-containing protein [Candidatus Omnitrophota bacterium]
MKREYRDYVKDILDAINKIEIFTQGIDDFESFLKDEKTELAVVKLFENIGEAVKKIPDEIKNKHSGTPWKDIAGMRDILIHEYFGLDAEVIWKTIKEDLPTIKPVIQKIWEEI